MEYTQSVVRGRGYILKTPRFSGDGVERINRFYEAAEGCISKYFDEICAAGGVFCRGDFEIEGSDPGRIAVRLILARRGVGIFDSAARREVRNVWVAPWGEWGLEVPALRRGRLNFKFNLFKK